MTNNKVIYYIVRLRVRVHHVCSVLATWLLHLPSLWHWEGVIAGVVIEPNHILLSFFFDRQWLHCETSSGDEQAVCRSPLVPYSLLCIVLPPARSPSSATDGSGSPAGHVLTAPLGHRGEGASQNFLCMCWFSLLWPVHSRKMTTCSLWVSRW